MVGNDPATIRELSLKFFVSAEKGVAEIEAALQRENGGSIGQMQDIAARLRSLLGQIKEQIGKL